jgi:hypothetical protein
MQLAAANEMRWLLFLLQYVVRTRSGSLPSKHQFSVSVAKRIERILGHEPACNLHFSLIESTVTIVIFDVSYGVK